MIGISQHSSEHSVNEFVDSFLSVSEDSVSVVRVSLVFKASLGRVQFEWPQEVVSLFKVWSSTDDFVDQVLDGDNTLLAERVFDDTVVGQGDSTSVNLSISSLVDQV